MIGVAIPYSDIKGIDLDFLNLHSKAMVFDADRMETIVLVPDEELKKNLERLKKEGKISYRFLTPEEVERYSKELLFGD